MGFKSKDRKFIYETVIGSNLYGTNSPKSDKDYFGVFLHSTEDAFNLDPRLISQLDLSVKVSTGAKNTAEDVDRKFLSLQEFFRLALSGQSRETEALFAPDSLVKTKTSEWELILKNRAIFLSKNSLSSFLSFAREQSIKATLKGEHLNDIRALISLADKEPAGMRVGHFLKKYEDTEVVKTVQYSKTGKGSDVMIFVGKKWDLNSSLKRIRENLKKMEAVYGPRSQQTALVGYDFKSLHHAYRLMFQSKEFLTTGEITLPRPANEADFLKKVKYGEYAAEYFKELNELEAEVKALIVSTNLLPDQPDVEKVKQLLKEIMYNHLLG